MRLVFIDESEQRDLPRNDLGPLVAVGAVVVPDNQIWSLADRIIQIRANLGIPDGEELKWKPKKGSYLSEAGGELVLELRQQLLRAASDCLVNTAVVVLDQGSVYRDHSMAEVVEEILPWLYERIGMCLDDRDDIGVVIADKPGGGAKAERKWLVDASRLTRYGTQYVQPGRVVLPMVTASSDLVPHLQLADLVTAATTAAIAGRKSGLALVEPLKELAHTRRTGEIAGAGVVLWPPEIYDLHWWVFGESHYWRGNVGTPLGPHALKGEQSNRRYVSNDGIRETPPSS